MALELFVGEGYFLHVDVAGLVRGITLFLPFGRSCSELGFLQEIVFLPVHRSLSVLQLCSSYVRASVWRMAGSWKTDILDCPILYGRCGGESGCLLARAEAAW